MEDTVGAMLDAISGIITSLAASPLHDVETDCFKLPVWGRISLSESPLDTFGGSKVGSSETAGPAILLEDERLRARLEPAPSRSPNRAGAACLSQVCVACSEILVFFA